MEQQRRTDNLNGIFSMWLGWIACSAALLAVMLTPLVTRVILTPLVAVVLEIVMFGYIRHGREHPRPRCLVVPFLTSRILFWSAVAMVTVLLWQHYIYPAGSTDNTFNSEIPLIPVLVMAPIGLCVCWWIIRRGHSFPFCVDCKLRFGTPAERGFLGMLFSQEGMAQVKALLIGFLLLSISSWAYYFAKYVNVSINDADLYYFFVIPSAFWVIAAIYMSLRYLGIYRYYDQDIEGSTQRHGTSTRIRFIIIGENRLLVRSPEKINVADAIIDLSRIKADTPAEIILPYRRDLPLHEAEIYLEGILPIHGQRMRFLYSNTEWNADCNIFHFIVNVDDETIEEINRTVNGAEWLTLHHYNELLKTGVIDSLLASEIHRIYTAAMAFKTYDTRGRRLYPIKHYRPTFRLCDVIDYKVDYNDRLWLYVARCNQDVPFYRLRSFWRRYINGLTY